MFTLANPSLGRGRLATRLLKEFLCKGLCAVGNLLLCCCRGKRERQFFVTDVEKLLGALWVSGGLWTSGVTSETGAVSLKETGLAIPGLSSTGKEGTAIWYNLNLEPQ